MRINEVESVHDLLKKINNLYKGDATVLFRGQRDQAWGLIPKIGRTPFRREGVRDVLEIEQEMFSEFERISVPFVSGKGHLTKWDKLALAQHHGLPTRLLDWSTNPLVALWFAVEKPSNNNADAAVWAFDVREEDLTNSGDDPLDTAKTQVFRPRHHDPRIIAQSGWFSVHKHNASNDRFSSLDSLASMNRRMRKFVIPAATFFDIRRDLARCGINKATLFPDLQGLCSHLLWHYSPLTDESESISDLL